MKACGDLSCVADPIGMRSLIVAVAARTRLGDARGGWVEISLDDLQQRVGGAGVVLRELFNYLEMAEREGFEPWDVL
jgi:hypothetical protein